MVTHNGHPFFITVPFSEELLSHGVHVTLAVQLFKEGNLSLGKAAKLANMPLVGFTEYVSEQNIPVVDFSEAEFEREMDNLDR